MKITIESTTRIVKANGIDCRVWEGESAGGVKCVCLIPRIAIKEGENAQEFERELQEQKDPSMGVQAFPLSMII